MNEKRNKKGRTSIKLLILIPILIVCILGIASNFLSLGNLKTVDNMAKDMTKQLMINDSQLNRILEDTQDLHGLALSHIIATDLDSMVSIAQQIDENEKKLEAEINACEASVPASMNDIANSISTITQAIVEGANGVNGATGSTSLLVEDMEHISERMRNNQQIAETLKESTAVFKSL